MNKWLNQRRVDALEVFHEQDGTRTLNHIAVKRKGNKLDLVAMNSEISSLQLISGLVPRGSPLVILVTGKGIIMRRSDFNIDTPIEILIKTVFPDVDPKDFLISRENLSEEGSLFCITRIKQAEEIISFLLAQGLFITEVLIGPLSVTRILTLLNSDAAPVVTHHYSFSHKNGFLVDVQTKYTESPPDINLGNLKIPPDFFLPFAAAFDFLIANRGIPTTPLKLVQENALEIRFVVTIKRILVISIYLLFLIVIANFIVFYHYNKTYNKLASVVESKRKTTIQIDTLRELIKRREAFLKQTSLTNLIKGSFLIDRIAFSKPDGILINDFSLYPISIAEGKEPVYQPQFIRILASVKESNALNIWIKRLKDLKWIKTVAFSNYRERENQEAVVTIEITLK